MQFNFRRSGPGAAIGCGTMLAFFGLFLISPVGVWLVRAFGWMSLVLGGIVVAAGIFSWITGSRNRNRQ